MQNVMPPVCISDFPNSNLHNTPKTSKSLTFCTNVHIFVGYLRIPVSGLPQESIMTSIYPKRGGLHETSTYFQPFRFSVFQLFHSVT
jgi:hypothetical protein